METKLCTIFGVEETKTNHLVKKALDSSVVLLDIFKFIDVTKFEVDPIMTNWFWQVMVENHCAHVGTVVLEWFGYEGDERTQKRKFVDMLKRNDIPFKELKHTDHEIELYPSIKEEISKLPHKGAVASSKWLIMEPFDIKMAMLRLNTKKANDIKKYYIKMEELIKTYSQYTYMFQQREKESLSREVTELKESVIRQEKMLERQEEERKQDRKMLEESHNMLRTMGVELKGIRHENSDLLDQNNELLEKVDEQGGKIDAIQTKLEIAVEDRAPQPKKNDKRERFILIKRNDEEYPYYTIRAQDVSARTALKRQRNLFSKVSVLLNISCHPNSKTLYVRIKDDLKQKGVVFNLCKISINNSDITEEDLIKAMEVVNEEKRDIYV